MAQRQPTIACEGVPPDEARRMSRGPRMDPQLCQQLRTRLQSLSDHAVRMTVPDGMSPTTMKNRNQRVAELGLPATIRRVPGGVLFWCSTDEDVQQAKEVGAWLQTAQRRRRARQGRRRAGRHRSHRQSRARQS